MENQGYEEEQHQPKQKEQPLSDESTASSRLPALHDSPSLSFPSTPPVRDHFPDSLSSPDGHVYEDISPESTLTSSSLNETKGHPLEYPLPRSSDAPSVESPLSAPETESCTFRRNLTLPFRRAIGFDLAGSGSSVRVTSREKTGCQDHDETLRASDFPSQDSLDPHRTRSTILRSGAERPGRRRRKKDCKHCRSRVGANVRESELEILEETILRRNRENEASSCNEGILATRRIGVPASLARKTDPAPIVGGTAVFSISEKVGESEGKALGPMEYERNDFRHAAAESEDKALIAGEKSRPTGMRVNSIYSQERWYAKEAPVFFTDVKEQNSFQRAYSLPVRTQTPSSQNRVNLRRSVRGEPPPHPARLRKHRHGWTLHLARPLEGSGCTRSLILLLIVILALLGVGAIALYIVFEPEKLQIIQQYLRSSNNSSRNALASGGTFLSSSKDRRNETSIVSTFSANGATLLSSDPPSNQSFPESTPLLPEPETEVTSPSTGNSTRYCDDCLLEEVCVALVDEEVPICRIALDRQDPTGCAGYCLINKQKCHRLDVDAFRCVEVEHYCLDDEWTCLNTLCIPLDKHCDGHMNCYDHSDEYNCDCNLETHFQCGNETSCLPLEKRCDGKIDCWDAADEINCTLGRNLGWSCPMDNEFTCSSGQCILKARFCDGLPDCADGSDEPHGCEGRCNKHEFTCQNNRCITKGMKCNGVDDCGDGTDERHCKDRHP